MKIPQRFESHSVKIMISLGYKQSQGDYILFIKHSLDDKLTLLLVYVDNMIILGDYKIEQLTLKESLSTYFEMKELGSRKNASLTPKQNMCLICLTRHENCLSRDWWETNILFHIRLNITYAISVVNQFTHNFRERHIQAIEKFIHYLKTSSRKGLLFRKEGSLSLEIYTNADYAGLVTDKRSTSGYCLFLGGNLVTWRSNKKNILSFEPSHDICEELWMKIILDDFKVKYEDPMKLFGDNNSAINIVHNPVQHDRTKHIEIDRQFIKEKLDTYKTPTCRCLYKGDS
ncbi:hypothetical protein CR513_38132, partial [Mucuna pruriens]